MTPWIQLFFDAPSAMVRACSFVDTPRPRTIADTDVSFGNGPVSKDIPRVRAMVVMVQVRVRVRARVISVI